MTLQYINSPIITLNKLNSQHNLNNEDAVSLVLLEPMSDDGQIERLCFRATTDTEPGMILIYLSPPGETKAHLIKQIPIIKHKKTTGTGVWESTLDAKSDPLFPLKLEKGFRLLATMRCEKPDAALDVTLIGGTFGRTSPLYQDRYLFERGAVGENHISGINLDDKASAYLPMREKKGAKHYRIDQINLHVPDDKWPLTTEDKNNENVVTLNIIIGRSDDISSNTITTINIKNGADGKPGAHAFFDHTLTNNLFPLFLPTDHYLGVRLEQAKTLKQIHVHFSGGYIDE